MFINQKNYVNLIFQSNSDPNVYFLKIEAVLDFVNAAGNNIQRNLVLRDSKWSLDTKVTNELYLNEIRSSNNINLLIYFYKSKRVQITDRSRL